MVDFRIRVVVDTSGAERGAKRFGDRLKRTTAQANTLRASLVRAFAIFGGIGILFRAIRQVAAFEQSLSTVQAVTGATGKEFAALSDEAKRLGSTTRFAATEAADAMVNLGRAGFDTAQVLESVGDTLLLAQAGALDLAQAADITASTLRGFRLETDQASRVTDVLALAANSANTNVAQLGNAIKFVAPVAAGLGISLEDTTAAITALSDAGLKGTLAGTGLRRVLAELEAPGEKLRKVLARVGKVAEDIAPSQVGLTKALEELREAGVDTGEALEIFGQRGGPAFEVLSSNIGNIKEMSKALQNAAGTARRVAEVMDDNLNGALLRVRSAFQAIVLEFFSAERAGGPLRRVVELLAQGFQFLAKNIEIVISIFEFLAILIGIRMVKAFGRMAIAIAANPLGAFITIVTVGLAALVAFSDQILATGDGLTTLADVAKTAFNAIRDAIGPVLESISASLEVLFGTGFEFTLRRLVETFAFTFDRIVGVVRGSVLVIRDLFVTQLGKVFDGTLAILQATGLRIKAFVEELANGLVNIFRAPIITIAKTIQILLNSVAGTAATAAALGAISEKTRLQVEDAVAGVEASINRLEGTTPKPLFDSAETRKQIADLDKQVSDSFGNIGENLSKSFREGFDRDTFLGFVSSVFDQAEEEARARRAAGPGPSRPTAPGGGGVPTAPVGGADQAADLTAFDKRIQQLQQEEKLLKMLLPLRGAAAQAQKEAAELGQKLNPVEQETLTLQIQKNQSLRTQIEILEELQGPEEQRLKTTEALNQLLASGVITLDQFNQKLIETKLAALEADQSISGGFSRGLLRIEQQINDVGSLAENVLVNAFNNAEDALVNFVRTGTFEFEQFVNQLLDDIARLLVRLLILQSVQAITGTGAAGGIGIPGLQAGGPVSPNKPFLVGEEGPEIFRPGTSGEIVPAAQTSAIMAGSAVSAAATTIVEVAAPAVNVTVINQTDPNEFADAVNSGELDIPIVNVMGRRKSASRQTLGI